MRPWDHYSAAYNAVHHRAMIEHYINMNIRLIEAILGIELLHDDDTDMDFDRLVFRAEQERSRLLTRNDELQRTIKALVETDEGKLKEGEQRT
jgi:hypothetical protein